jgi:hypothetical protein
VKAKSPSDERSAGNRHATFCGSRERVTAPGDPVRLARLRINRPYRDRKNTEGSKNELIKLMSAAIFPGSNPALSVRTVDYRN